MGNRRHQLNIYLNDDDWERFQALRKRMAQSTGLQVSRSEFARKLIRDGLDQLEDGDE